MARIEIDDGFFDHPKVLWVGRDARDLHLRVVAWCRRYSASAGVFAESILPALAVAEGLGGQEQQLVERLLSYPPGWKSKRGLWEHGPELGSYQVHDFDEYTGTATARRSSARERMRKLRDRSRNNGELLREQDRNGSRTVTRTGPGDGVGLGEGKDQEGSMRGEEGRGEPRGGGSRHTVGPPAQPLPVKPRLAVEILDEHGAPRLKLVRNRATETGLPELLERHLVGILAEYRPDAEWLERAGCLIAGGELWGHLKAGVSGQALLGKAGGPGTLAEVLELTREAGEAPSKPAADWRRPPLTADEEAQRKAMLDGFLNRHRAPGAPDA